ncbi:hypothetical protein J0H58_16545 [bacterium]|nr:hypothetical protein [bacterium]
MPGGAVKATGREAAQKLLTTLVYWDVLRAAEAKGRFIPAPKLMATTPDLQLWLLEALLMATGPKTRGSRCCPPPARASDRASSRVGCTIG